MRIKFREFLYISNLLSLSRIIIVIPIVYLISINTPTGNIILVSLAVIGASTDILDGYLSRKLNQVTDLGILLDPIADKIAMALVFIALIVYRDFPIPLIVLLLYRDLWILISGLLLLKRSGKPMMANLWGKVNTVVFALLALLILMNTSKYVTNIFIFIGYLTLVFSTISYGISGLRVFTNNYFVRAIIWSLVVIPAAILSFVMRELHYFI